MTSFRPLHSLSGILLVAVSTQAAVSAAPRAGTDRVAITEVSDDPRATSGVVAFAVKVSGTTDEGKREYFIPFMTVGQPKPYVGQVCSIKWSWFQGSFDWLLANGDAIRSGRQIENFHC